MRSPVSESSQCQAPLCSICQNQVTPSSRFSAIASGSHDMVDQLPRLENEIALRLNSPLSEKPRRDGGAHSHWASHFQLLAA